MTTREIGWAGMPVRPTFEDFTPRTVEAGTSRAMLVAGKNSGDQFGSAAGKSASSRFGSIFKAGAKAALLGIGAAGAVAIKVGIDSVGLASDLAESENKVKQVFGDSAERIFGFSSKAAEKLGQTNQQARDAAATFGIFANAADLSDKRSARFSTRLTRLASDLASFNNTSPEQAIGALGAALRGEGEPIRNYGVLLDEATLKAEALSLGLLKPVKDQSKIKTYQVAILEGQRNYNEAVSEHGKKSLEALKAEASLGTARDRLKKATEGTIEPLTQQQKILAAQSAIFKQTSIAQGDFDRTSDGLANRQRILTARWTDAKTELGDGLLPVMEDATGFILDHGVPAVEKFAKWFSEKATPAIGDFIDDAKPLAHDILPTVRDLVDDLVGGFGDLAPLAKNVFDGFNNLPEGVKKGLLVGGGLVAANKLLGNSRQGGNAGGQLALTPGGLVSATKGAVVTKSGELLADKLLAKFQKPLPVFVTNPGAIGGGGKGGALSGAAAGAGTGAASVVRSLALPAVAAVTIASATTVGITKLSDLLASKETEAGRFGTPQFGTGIPIEPGGILDFSKPETTDKTKKLFDDLTSKAGVFGKELDLVGSKKINPSLTVPGLDEARGNLQKFIAEKVAAGKPVTPYIALDGFDRAMQQVNTLSSALHALPGAGIGDGGAVFLSGGAQRAGITNNFNGPMHVADGRDLTREAEKKSRSRSRGGR